MTHFAFAQVRTCNLLHERLLHCLVVTLHLVLLNFERCRQSLLRCYHSLLIGLLSQQLARSLRL